MCARGSRTDAYARSTSYAIVSIPSSRMACGSHLDVRDIRLRVTQKLREEVRVLEALARTRAEVGEHPVRL